MKYLEIDGVDYEILPHIERLKKILLGNPMMNYLAPRRMLLHLLKASGSPLLLESMERPGGWRAMEIIYENQKPRNFIDRMVIRYGAFPMAIRNRKRLLNCILRGLIDQYAHQGRVIIISVGSGPGTHVIDAMADHDHEEVHAYCIDLDSDAFEYGELHKREHGLDDRIYYIEGDARQIHEHVRVSPHIVKMTGILEYLNDGECIELLKVMHRALVPGGSLVTHGLVDRHNSDRFLKRILNWHVYYRTKDDVIRLLDEASLSHLKVSTEPMGIYPIVIAVKK